MFADSSFGPSKADRFSTVRVEGDVGALWFAQTTLLFHLYTRSKIKMLGELSIVRYFEITPATDIVDRALNCHCFRWAVDDGIDHNVSKSCFRCTFY